MSSLCNLNYFFVCHLIAVLKPTFALEDEARPGRNKATRIGRLAMGAPLQLRVGNSHVNLEFSVACIAFVFVNHCRLLAAKLCSAMNILQFVGELFVAPIMLFI